DAKTIREGYDEIADQIVMPVKFYRACLDLIGSVSDGAKVLDVGCGQGLLLREFKKRFSPEVVFGLDHSLELCRRAGKNIDSATVTEADIHFAPFRSSSFAVVMMTEVLEHVTAPEKVLKELWRLVEPGGRLLLSVPNREWLRYDRYLKRRSKFQPVDDRWFGVDEIKGYIESAGFSILKVRGQENLYFGGGPGRALEKVGLACIPTLHEKMKRLIILSEKAR
ncbi:MAG: methyltransferase domain-containing protein, partial [Thermodesulfobacteriota bacterium]